MDALWTHSVTTAAAAHRIAIAEHLDQRPGRGRVSRRHAARHRQAGARHGHARASTRRVLEQAERPARRAAREIEMLELQAAHTDVGAYLVGLWGLPNTIAEAIAFHEDPVAVAEARSACRASCTSRTASRTTRTSPIARTPELGPEFRPISRSTSAASKWNEWREICAADLAQGKSVVKDPRPLRRRRTQRAQQHPRPVAQSRSSLETATSAAAGLDNHPSSRVRSPWWSPTCACRKWMARVSSPRSTKSRRTPCAWCSRGQADLDSTIAAVNEGRIFRFLLKPCDSDNAVRQSINSGIEQYRPDPRREAPAREHAQRHRQGAVSTCWASSIRSRSSRASQIERYAESGERGAQRCRTCWKYHLAAMLSQLGCITLPAGDAGASVYGGQAHVGRRSARLYESHPEDRRQAAGHDPAPRGRRRHGGGPDARARARISPAAIPPRGSRQKIRRRHPLDRGALRSATSPRAARPSRRAAAREPGRARTCRRRSPQAMVKAPVDDARPGRESRA